MLLQPIHLAPVIARHNPVVQFLHSFLDIFQYDCIGVGNGTAISRQRKLLAVDECVELGEFRTFRRDPLVAALNRDEILAEPYAVTVLDPVGAPRRVMPLTPDHRVVAVFHAVPLDIEDCVKTDVWTMFEVAGHHETFAIVVLCAGDMLCEKLPCRPELSAGKTWPNVKASGASLSSPLRMKILSLLPSIPI